MDRMFAHLAWPTGLAIVMAATAAALPLPVTLPLCAALGLGYALIVRRLTGGRPVQPALGLAVAGVGLFALVGFIGPPTAAEPVNMLLNAVVLLAAAAALLWSAVALALRLRSGPAVAAAVLLAVGSVGYLLNLLARWAVVLSGAAPAQAAIEDRAWMAAAYLRGLDGEPTYLTYLLVWFDLVQVTYLVLSYAAAAALAVGLGRAGLLQARFATAVARTGAVLAALVCAAAIVAAIDGPVGTVAAWTAFALTIPFMSTLLPHVLGVALLAPGRSATHPDPVHAAPALAR
jgi:hypothetical protein